MNITLLLYTGATGFKNFEVDARKWDYDRIALVSFKSKKNEKVYEDIKNTFESFDYKYLLVDLNTGMAVAMGDSIKYCEGYFNRHIDRFEELKQTKGYKDLVEQYDRICKAGTLFEN